MANLQQRCVNELKDLHEMFKSTAAKLGPEPQDLPQLSENLKLWEQKMNSK